jgi:hypothetical protein
MTHDSRRRKEGLMRKLSLVFIALVVLAFAPAALACASCDGERCDWAPEYFALDCWFDFCPPCGCFTTGHCHPGLAAQTTDLALEYNIASVEIRQGDVLVASKTEEAPAVIAEKQTVHR